jgi:transmembrane sensor
VADDHPIPGARKAEYEASEWIARLNADHVSAEDRARFEAWRRSDLLNSRAFEELSRTWNRFSRAGQLARGGVPGRPAPPLKTYRGSRRWKVPAAAAAALLVVALAIGTYVRWMARPETFQTAVGVQFAVNLPDGSLMEMNSNTRVQIDFDRNQRVVRLERGEAFFKVVHNAARPFWVATPDGWARDVGTQFDVYVKPGDLLVTVSEGAVQVGAGRGAAAASGSGRMGSATVTLARGQQADLASGRAVKRTLSAERLAEAVAWRGGSVFFEDRPLGEVVSQLNRYSVEQLVLEGDALRKLRVGGVFQANPRGAAALLRMLEHNFGVMERREGKRIYLRGPGSGPNSKLMDCSANRATACAISQGAPAN